MQENEFGVLQLKAFRELKPYFLFEPVIPSGFVFFGFTAEKTLLNIRML